MLDGLNTAAAGMAAQQARIDSVANDLANVSTTGYKHGRTDFHDLVYQSATGFGDSGGVRTGTGVAAVDAGRSMSQGALEQTGEPLDVAIQGAGFLRVKLPDGTAALTRDGSLHVDGLRRLSTSTGAIVQPPVTIPKGIAEADVEIGSDGSVKAGGRSLGRIEVVAVRSTGGLRALGENAFAPTAASGPVSAAPRATTLVQGALEASNVDMAEAMTGMIEAQRSYQLASKAIQTADQMLEIANGVKR